MRRISILNKKFSRLLVVKEMGSIFKNGRSVKVVLCKCDCGNEKVLSEHEIKYGNTKSCGCLKNELLIERSTTHNLSHHPLLHIWGQIKERCYTKTHTRYCDYGAIGITMCEEWKNDFKSFYEWAMKNGWQKGLCIDKDIKGGRIYSPENCLIVTTKENNNKKKNNIIIEYKGVTLNLSQWAEKLNLNYHMLLSRMKRHNPTPAQLFETKNRYWKYIENKNQS